MSSHCLEAMAQWLGVDWTPEQRSALTRYADWLGSEAASLGGIGPHEIDRLWERHICDSLVFGRGLHEAKTLLDVGSGVGLPGVPLAIAFPHVDVGLLERSGRRCDALHRIAAILGLRLEILHTSTEAVDGWYDRLVFRGSLRIEDAIPVAERLLTAAGEAWFGLGRGSQPVALTAWRTTRPPIPEALTIEEVHVPSEILDGGVWLLRMCRS